LFGSVSLSHQSILQAQSYPIIGTFSDDNSVKVYHILFGKLSLIESANFEETPII